MNDLINLIAENNIQSTDNFRKLIEGKVSIGQKHAFKIVRESDLKLDSEHRLHEELFKHNHVIFDCAEISLENCSMIDLRNCIVLGSLRIRSANNKISTLYIDNSIISDLLQLSGNGHAFDKVDIANVSCPSFRLANFKSGSLSIMGSSFAITEIEHIFASTLDIYNCALGKFEIWGSKFDDISFPPGQVDPLHHLGTYSLEKFLPKPPSFNPFRSRSTGVEIDKHLDHLLDHEEARRRIETMDFLRHKTDLSYSKHDVARLKYLRALAESQSKVTQFLVFLTGAFLSPIRIFLLSSFVVVFFAILYAWLTPSFIINGSSCAQGACQLKFYDALYFSGITFTTVGYGDIVPLGYARLFAVIEAIFGIVMSSSLVVSIVRRYVIE